MVSTGTTSHHMASKASVSEKRSH